jgi:glycosyltransferase involved in cell wall biosynthesis
MKLSAFLITLNEGETLDRCLRSCADLVDEIVIVDAGSQDTTPAVARRYGARFIRHDWLGFVAQKNLALSYCTGDWALSLDGDEELSPRLREEIGGLRHAPPPDHVAGYTMPRCLCYQGRWIRHGEWYPDRLPRLFRRERGQFAGGSVHERIEIKGGLCRLAGDLHHYAYRDEADHWERCQRYAQLWAADRVQEGRRAGLLTGPSHAAYRWLDGYVLKLGFLDGKAGWSLAKTCARYVALKYRLLRELQAKDKGLRHPQTL